MDQLQDQARNKEYTESNKERCRTYGLCMKNITNQVRHQVIRQIALPSSVLWGIATNQACDQVVNQVSNQVRRQAWSQIKYVARVAGCYGWDIRAGCT